MFGQHNDNDDDDDAAADWSANHYLHS